MNKIIFPLTPDAEGEAVADLQDLLQLCFDKKILLPEDEDARKQLAAKLKRERAKQFYGKATSELVGLFQKEQELEQTEAVDELTAKALNKLWKKWQPRPEPDGEKNAAKVTGKIVLAHGTPASKVPVLLYQRGFGGTKTLLEKTETDELGNYVIPYSTQGKANIEIYAVGADGTETQLSQTMLGAQAEEHIDLIAPGLVQPAAAEFARLTSAVAPHISNKPENLKDAVERGDRRDFTYLAAATGWDAAAIAIAAEAFEIETATKIPAQGLYALARAGLPMDVKILANVPKQRVESAYKQAAEAGIIDASSVDESMKAFVEFAAEYKFVNKLPGTQSSPKDFVTKAPIAADDREMFEKVIRDDGSGDLWERAKSAGVSDKGIKNLQLQGKLAYLTFNNAEVADYLANQIESDVIELIKLGFYEAVKWDEALQTLAEDDDTKLGTLIPPAFSGRNVKERLLGYTTELARRVRQMDTHAVTVDRIATSKIGGVDARKGVTKFLKKAVPLGFRLGKTPLSSFVAKNKSALWTESEKEEEVEEVLASMRTLTALYGMTPSDEALSALLLAGYKSATAIAQEDYAVFKARIENKNSKGPKAGDKNITPKIYWKAQQISSTVFNVFDGLKRLKSPTQGLNPTSQDVKARDDQILKARKKLSGLFPTLENLFGSVDYCQCNHCQSVLSPAAYLVDLLHFIDPKEEAWVMAKASYEVRTGFPYKQIKPFDALNNRRPDIKNIALTCENTHTALPYIDVVNEVLEQLMMSDTAPHAIEAYDVGEVSSADLLAEPQNILWDAYDGTGGKSLREKVYPATLPFDLPLEMARAFLKQLGLPLWRLREYLARPTKLGASTIDKTDGWMDVWFERLGFGPHDAKQLTRATDDWHTLYGYEAQTEALATKTEGGVPVPAESSLGNAKTLSRRLGVTYEELVELLRTRFINPEIENLIVLKGLGIDPNTVDRFLGQTLSTAEKSEFNAAIQAQDVTAEQLRALRTDAVRKVTLELSSPSDGCDFSKTTLAFDKAPADPADSMKFALRKMSAFVRLQRKLGWEIHELDRALMALMPGIDTLAMSSWPKAMQTALIYLAHVEELREHFEGRLNREEIITFWSDIPTVGISCLYERLFMASGAAVRNDVFKKKLGKVLQNAGDLIDHADAVRQAFAIAHEDIEPILATVEGADRKLSIKNLSILMRHASLAKGLGLSVSELLALMKLSERKPLSALAKLPLDPPAQDALAQDVPWSETLAFIREVKLFREAGVDVAFLERLCRYQGVMEQPVAAKDPVLIALAALPPAATPPTANQQILVVQTLAAQLSVSESIIDTLLGSVLKDSSNDPLKRTGFSNAAKSATSVVKLRQALDLVQTLGLNKVELEYLIGVPENLNPNDLPVTVVTDPVAKTLRKKLTGWLEFAAARKQFQPSERMLAVLISATQTIDAVNTVTVREQQLHQAMGALTGLELPGLAQSLKAVGAVQKGTANFSVPALASPVQLRQTIEALKCLVKLGLNPDDMVALVSNAIDKAPAQKLRAAVKAKYSASAWRAVAKPIFDGLRRQQRDALVAHLTHVMNAAKTAPRYGATAEKLFEYLLLDPGMEPVVDASRIQLAIASVQLFVQRCLMNLEQDVNPQIIDNKRWEWMRRYRVWEVNRKMYIWPENWLDPEFRDNKTHLFRALEGKLLQGDVNDDLVRGLLHSYLNGLEEIARLEMLTMYFEPGASADGAIIHVVGRTPNAPHKYFYRKVSHGMWTPWEPIDVGIEGEHLVLTAWRGRMYLFWLSFLEQPKENSTSTVPWTPNESGDGGSISTAGLGAIPHVKLQLHWVEQVQGKWVGRNSTPNFVDTDFVGFKATDDEQKRKFFVRAVVIEREAGIEDDDLEIRITSTTTYTSGGGASTSVSKAHQFIFFSKLAPPLSKKTDPTASPTGSNPSQPDSPPSPPFLRCTAEATKWGCSGGLSVNFVSAITQSSERTPASVPGEHNVIGGTGKFRLLFPSNDVLSIPARTPPAGVGRPSGYVFKPQNAHHVTYRSGDGAIHDLYGTENGWFYQSPSADATGQGTIDAEPASSDPHGYAVDDRGTICIAYAGETKIHELVWSQLDSSLDDLASLNTGWRIETLYEGTTTDDQPFGGPCGGMFLPRRGVVFRTRGGQLRAAAEKDVGGSWEIQDLNDRGSMVEAYSDPVGILMTKTELGVTRVISRHVFCLGDDNHVHEFRSDAMGEGWDHTNITRGLVNYIQPAHESTLTAYAFLAQNTLHVVYRGEDGRIHELLGNAGSWQYIPIGKNFRPAKGDPAGYATEWASTHHVVYRGVDNELVELWWSNGQWREYVLIQTAPTSQDPILKSDVAGYSFESIKTQHVVYFSEDGSPRELWWDKTGWHKGSYELQNPFQEDVGPLATPFFYESGTRDHTFFVEPYVVETTVHEWTGWIITTEEYVDLLLREPKPVMPAVITMKPATVSLLKVQPDSYAPSVYGDGVVVKTSKGVIQPRISLGSEPTRMVDVTKGPQDRDLKIPHKLFGVPQ